MGTPSTVSIKLDVPIEEAMNLVVAVTANGRAPIDRCLAHLKDFEIKTAVAGEFVSRPKFGAPKHRQRARLIDEEAFKTAELRTPYPSELPMLMLDPKGGGLFVRPHPKGPVVAEMPYAFPPFARKLTAEVEITHDKASPFEFGLAIVRPYEQINWKRGFEQQALAFSGWVRVDQPYERVTLKAVTREPIKSHMNVLAAIRLPRGSAPDPSNSFFKKLVLHWEE